MNRAANRPNEAPMPDPLAYFLTWATYGTWLPGDERGWVDYRHGWKLPDPILKLESGARMSEDACVLDADERRLVERTIRDHCRIRGWELFEVNCRTNHLHVVVGADLHPDDIRKQLKAWCTRRLKELQQRRSSRTVRENWWAQRGSRRYINDEESLEAAILYVRDAQDKRYPPTCEGPPH